MTPDAVAKAILRGNKRAAAELITALERGLPQAAVAANKLRPHTGRAHVVGIAGAQGVGKSSLIDQLIAAALAKKKKVGVLAVDPTSPFTGGAFLGDRVRMQRHATQPAVFIRSMAGRGHPGGLSPALRDAIRVLDAAGYDPIFVETIGIGQDETQIAFVTDTTVLVLSPQSGDKIQALKAGILEACDLVALNKCDLAGAKSAATLLQSWISAPLVCVSAAKGKGIEALYEKIEEHWRKSNQNAQKRRKRNRQIELRERAEAKVLLQLRKKWKKHD